LFSIQYLIAFLVGGAICAVAQLVLDTTKCTPAHVLVATVSIGAIMQGLGLYEPFQDFAGAGALVPVSGFGSSITKGMLAEAKRLGWYGLFTGAFEITGLGLVAAIVFSSVISLFRKPLK
jgi:stage V sporulation protein AE